MDEREIKRRIKFSERELRDLREDSEALQEEIDELNDELNGEGLEPPRFQRVSKWMDLRKRSESDPFNADLEDSRRHAARLIFQVTV